MKAPVKDLDERLSLIELLIMTQVIWKCFDLTRLVVGADRRIANEIEASCADNKSYPGIAPLHVQEIVKVLARS
jgi:hypothetical protein